MGRCLRFRRGGKQEDLQELSCARPVTLASSAHSGKKVDMRVACPQDVKKCS